MQASSTGVSRTRQVVAAVIGNPKALPSKALDGLAETMRTREIRLPGLPGKVKNLKDLYRK